MEYGQCLEEKQSYFQYMNDPDTAKRVVADASHPFLMLAINKPDLLLSTLELNPHPKLFEILLLGSATPDNIRSLRHFVAPVTISFINGAILFNHIIIQYLTKGILELTNLASHSSCYRQGGLHISPLQLGDRLPTCQPIERYHYTIIDIVPEVIQRHAHSEIASMVRDVDYTVMDARMLGIRPRHVNLIISDMVTNYFPTHKDNVAHIECIERTLAPGGIALFSTIIDTKGHPCSHNPSTVVTNSTTGETRFAWTVPYYLELFEQHGFEAHEFGTKEATAWTQTVLSAHGDHIPHRRYILSAI